MLLFAYDRSYVIYQEDLFPIFYLRYALNEMKRYPGLEHPNSVEHTIGEIVSILVLELLYLLCFHSLRLRGDVKTLLVTHYLMILLGKAFEFFDYLIKICGSLSLSL